VGTRLDLDAEQDCIIMLNAAGHSVIVDGKGITMSDKDGNFVSIAGGEITIVASKVVNVSAGSVNIASGGVFLGQGAAKRVVLGEDLIQYLATHTHGTGTGPSSPPLQPPSPSMLSQKVKTA
jgi:hypothetical protein